MTKINKRFFAFGCSFTGYKWPTWADILGKQFEYCENWGQSGAGNQYIFNSLIECNLKNKISSTDVVCVMWTNVYRIDRYIGNRWLTPGNIYSSGILDSDRRWMNNFQDIRGYYIRDLAIIYATEQLLKSIGCQYHFLSMVPLTNIDQYTVVDASDQIDDLIEFYKETLNAIAPSVFEVVFDYNWHSRPFLLKLSAVRKIYNNVAGPDWPTFEKFMQRDFTEVKSEIVDEILDENRWEWKGQRQDLHPIPSEHLIYLNKVLPEYYISADTEKWVYEIDKALWQKVSYNHLWDPVVIKRW
jgi:hypothetical protein